MGQKPDKLFCPNIMSYGDKSSGARHKAQGAGDEESEI
jgi:hypothetical protein